MSLSRFAKRSKYRAIPTVVDGIRFSSKAEAKRYGELKLLERAGEISDLNRQQRYPLRAYEYEDKDTQEIGHYVGDFEYLEKGKWVVEDVKGFMTPLAKWKIKHFEIQYGIKVQLIKSARTT
jgi:hypothetical protein